MTPPPRPRLAAQMDSDRVWERPTKPFKRTVEEAAWARLGVDDPHQVLGENATRNPGRGAAVGRKLPPTERRAVEILEAKDNMSKQQIRKAYKALIKVLHPDMNGGDRSQEEQLVRGCLGLGSDQGKSPLPRQRLKAPEGAFKVHLRFLIDALRLISAIQLGT